MKTECFSPTAAISEKLIESASLMCAAVRHMSSLDPVFMVQHAKAVGERPIDST